MKVLKVVSLSVLAVAALFVVGGLFLRRDWHVERTTVIEAPPEAIYARVGYLKRWQEWAMGDLETDPSVVNTYSGPDHGVGATWSWQGSKRGNGTLTVVRADPKTGVATEEKGPDGQGGGHGVIAFSPEASGTRVTWTDQGMLPAVFGGYSRRMLEEVLGEYFQGALKRLKTATEKEAADAGVAPASDAG